MTDLVQASQRKHALPLALLFILITYAVTWVIFFWISNLPNTAFAGAPEATRQALVLPAVFVPAIVALALSAFSGGFAGVKTLLAPLLRGNVGWRWYVFAAGFMIVVKLAVALVYGLAFNAWPRFGAMPWGMMAISILVSTPFQIGEELGWRGFLLPRLAAKFGFAPAGLLVGPIWAAWHLPLFFMQGSDTYGQSFLVYALAVTGLSVAITWLYVNTRGSLLLAMVMHAAANNTAGIVLSDLPQGANPWSTQSSPVGWLTAAVLGAFAACFLVAIHLRRKRGSAGRDGATEGDGLAA